MQTARLALGLSQKDLAAKVNEKQSVLQDIESGRATANPQVLGKIERQLGVKLRGSYCSPWFGPPLRVHAVFTLGTDIGKKLEGPKRAAAA